MFAPGRGQHDRVRQRCDRQRGPPLCHRSAPHRGGRGHPEALAGPLRRVLCPLEIPTVTPYPIHATHHNSQRNRLITDISVGGRRSGWGVGGFTVRAKGSLCGGVSWWWNLSHCAASEAASCLHKTKSCPDTASERFSQSDSLHFQTGAEVTLISRL